MSTLTTPSVINRMAELVHQQSAKPLQPMDDDMVALTTELEDEFWSIAYRNDLCYGGVLTAGRSTLFRLATWVAVDLAFRSDDDVVTRDVVMRAIRVSAEFLVSARIAREQGADWHPDGNHDIAFGRFVALAYDNARFCAAIDGTAAAVPTSRMLHHNPIGVSMSGLTMWRGLIYHGVEFFATNYARPSCCGLQDCMTEPR